MPGTNGVFHVPVRLDTKLDDLDLVRQLARRSAWPLFRGRPPGTIPCYYAHHDDDNSTMKLVLVQPDVVWEDRDANFTKVRGLLRARPPSPRALIVLPEMFSVGYSMDVNAIGEDEVGPTEEFLHELAGMYDAAVVGGLVTRQPNRKGLNAAVAVDPDGNTLARYAKLHPFSYAGEHDHYEPGREITLFEWEGLTIAPFVCYDLRFPEIYRLACMRGAEVYLTIANWPTPRLHHWKSLLKARAIENQAYVAGVNRCGSDPNVSYAGKSLVVDPHGRVVAEAGGNEEVLAVDVSAEEVRTYRESFPVLRDLRNDLLGPL